MSVFRFGIMRTVAMCAALLCSDSAPSALAQSVQGPHPTPAPASLNAPAVAPVTALHLCDGIAGEAVAQGTDPKSILSAVEFALNEYSAVPIFFDPEKSGQCSDGSGIAYAGILEVTYGRIRGMDDNYILLERHFDGLDIGVVLRSTKDRSIVSEYPQQACGDATADSGAWWGFGKSSNQISLLGITGAVLVLNAKNTDKTASAGVSVLSSFSQLKVPFYHGPQTAYDVLLRAARNAAAGLYEKRNGSPAILSPKYDFGEPRCQQTLIQ